MYNTIEIAEIIFDKLKNNIDLTVKEKEKKIDEISELLIEEYNKALNLLGVSKRYDILDVRAKYHKGRLDALHNRFN